MLGEIIEIDVDCCNNSVFSYHQIYDPDEENFLSIDRGTPVICGDCVGCGSFPLLVKITETEDFSSAPEGTEIVAAYNCEGFKGDKACSHVTFGKPIVLLLKYDPDALDDDDLSSVFIARYNSELGEWEPLPPDPGGVAGIGEIRVLTSSFSMFAVIADLEPESPPEPEPPVAAHFVIGDLEVKPSGRFVGIGNIAFTIEQGKNVTISAGISNDGGQIGNYNASLVINGEAASARDVTLGPG
jgi:hypothetical protein